MYDQETVDRVFVMLDAGHSIRRVSRVVGVPRRTIGDWKAGGKPDRRPRPLCRIELSAENEPSYAYLLGLYLGDGYLVRCERGVFKLQITLDAAYPGIVREAAAAVGCVLPQNRVAVDPRKYRAVDVRCCSKRWPLLFPQHGSGRKHERRIWLRDWQRVVTSRYPHALIRGLIHSDGCRYIARQRRHGQIYSYPRYGFSNRSADIIGIFCEHLELLGVQWTLATDVCVQIARKDSVALLDSFIGPKR